MSTLKRCVGLFGTCGGSRWRDGVIAKLAEAGIASFNPQIEGRSWTPEDGTAEVEHLENDGVLMMVVTGETTAEGSLGESGWLALSAIQRGQKVHFVIQPHTESDPKSGANRARKLVRQKIESAMRLNPDSIFLHESIEAATAAVLAAEGAS